MNIEEYAAQFPTIKREDIKGGQTVLAQSEDFFVQHVAHSCESFSSYKTLRLVKDIEPQFEDGFMSIRRVIVFGFVRMVLGFWMGVLSPRMALSSITL